MIGALAGAKAAEGLAQNKATPYVIGGILLVGMGLAYFGIVRPLLCKTGLANCKKDKKIRDVMRFKGFDPNYSRPGKVTLSHQRAKQLADQVYRSGGIFNDDEGGFYGALEEAGSADNLSLVARMFAARYGQSLAAYLTYYLDGANELQRIKDILSTY